MNIFASSHDPAHCALYLPDILVNNMARETAQLLSTAHVVLDNVSMTYKATHKNHPCAVWCRESILNYSWLFQHFVFLCEEYKFRTGKVHGCSKLLLELSYPPKNMRNIDLTPHPKCMPDERKVECVHESYRNYLTAKYAGWAVRDKPIYVKWTKRLAPDWLPQYRQASRVARVMQLKRL